MKEQPYLQTSGVTVTATRFITSTMTVAISNITSVRIGHKDPSRTLPMLLIAIFGLATFLTLKNPTTKDGNFAPLCIYISLTASCIYWYRSCRPTFILFIATAASETESFQSPQQHIVESIYQAINAAIAREPLPEKHKPAVPDHTAEPGIRTYRIG
jgi:hypothetical protein